MAKVLVLDTHRDWRETFKRDLKAADVVSTVEEALKKLRGGGVEYFRTNFIDDNAPLGEGALFSLDAIREALSSGILVEIGTSSDSEYVQKKLAQNGLSESQYLHIVPKTTDKGRLFPPGASFEGHTIRGEREEN